MNVQSTGLSDLFPDEDYRFQMRFQRGDIAEFFGPTPRGAAILAERRHWLRTAADAYAALQPEGKSLLAEATDLAKRLNPIEAAGFAADSSARQRCVALGETWEPDFLLLRREAGGPFKLAGGCVCFPSSWSLAEKIGRPLDLVHEVVPGLNADLGRAIDTFLARLRPGTAWRRSNWGLSASPELNYHPDRRMPRLGANPPLTEVWLRVEHQALVALPQTGGVLFGIRIAVHPLSDVKRELEAARKLERALRTMPDSVAVYKGIAEARPALIRLLKS